MGCGAGKEQQSIGTLTRSLPNVAGQTERSVAPPTTTTTPPHGATGPKENVEKPDSPGQLRDGKAFPVVFTGGTLHVNAAEGIREVSLSIRCAAADKPLQPTDDAVKTSGSGFFQMPAKKQKLVSYFMLDDSTSPITGASVLKHYRETTAACTYTSRMWGSDLLGLNLCLTVMDSVGHRVEYEAELNLLDGKQETAASLAGESAGNNDDEAGASLSLQHQQQVITAQFKSIFSTKSIATFEFSFRVLFRALRDGAVYLRIAASSLESQHPLIFEVVCDILRVVEQNVATKSDEVVEHAEKDIEDLLDVLQVLTSESKISFLKNKLKGQELADKYRTICKKLCFSVGGLLPSDRMVERIDQSAASIVDVSSSFFDSIMVAKDGAVNVKNDVTAFLSQYRSSVGETAAAGADAGGSFSQLAALLCDVQGLVEPLIRAAPFGMLVIEAVGVVFKLIVGRSDMLEMCGRIASRLAIFLRVLQEPEVQDLLKEDAATLEACVGVYIAIDDCSECMRRFQARNIAVQLFSATSQLKALQQCYNELHEQFDILHNVTSLRAMAAANVHHTLMEHRIEQLLIAQQSTLLACDANASVLSKMLASVDSMQDQLVRSVHDRPEAEAWTDALVYGTVKQAICDASRTEMAQHLKDVSHRTGGPHGGGGDDLQSAVLEGLSAAAAAPQTSVSELASFASAMVAMWKSGPHLPAAFTAQTPEALVEVIQKTESGLLMEMKTALQTTIVQHKKTRAEVRAALKTLEEEFRSAQASNVSIGKKLEAAMNGVGSELREVRNELQGLTMAIAHPLKQIEEHIRQYTNFHAMNKPVEICEVDLVLGDVVYVGETSEVRRGSFQNRDVVVKKYRAVVEPSVRREEAMTLFQIHHSHIVELIATVADPSLHGIPSQLVLERLGGPLRDILTRASHHLTREQRLLFTYDIVGGINFLHSLSPPRVHCQIDLSNVLVTTDVRGVKLIDFKLSQASSSASMLLHAKHAAAAAVGTSCSYNRVPTGTAPELVLADSDVVDAQVAPLLAHTISSDTYAAGIALYELWTGNIAFRGKSGKLLLKALRDGDEPFSTSDLQQLPRVIQALLAGLTDANVVRRLSLSQVLRLQDMFGQSLLEAPETAWCDYFPFWNKKRSEDGDSALSMTLCTENIPKFAKAHLRKYLIEKEIATAIVEHIEKKGYTARQYLRIDFVHKAFPPEDRSKFDVLHLDSFVELQEFDAEYHQQPKGPQLQQHAAHTDAAIVEEEPSAAGVSSQAHRSHICAESPPPPHRIAAPNRVANSQRRALRAASCVVRMNSMIAGNKKKLSENHGWMDAASAAHEDAEGIQHTLTANITFGNVSDDGSTAIINSNSAAVSEFDRLFNLGSCEAMELDGFVIENGVVLTKKECYRRALEATDGGKLSSTRSAAWVALGAALAASSEVVSVGETSYTRKDCFSRAVTLDPTSTDGWATLTAILAANETVNVSGKEYSRRNCAEQAAACAPKDPGLWVLLASCLAVGESATVEVAGETPAKHSKRSCLVNALTLSPTTARYWYLLSQTLKEGDSVDVGTQKGVNKLAALVEYVSCDTTSGHAWLNLGLRLDTPAQQTVMVHGKDYTRKLCFVEAANCGASEAYNYLGFEMNRGEQFTIAGGTVDTVVAYCRGLEHDDSSFSLWNNLGVEMVYRKMYPPQTVDIGGRKLTMTDVFLCAVERDPQFGKAWNGLGISLGDNQTITVLQRVYTKQQCYLKSLSLLPNYMYAWNWLGMTLVQPDDCVVVNGESVTKRKCFQKAIELGWDYAYPWWNLMMSMADGDTAMLRGASMSYQEVVSRAHELYPNDKDVLERLAALQ